MSNQKQQILRNLDRLINKNDLPKLVLYIEGTFSHDKLYKTCIAAGLIRKAEYKPSKSSLASILGKTLINTRASWTRSLLTLLAAWTSAKSASSLLPTSQHAINKQIEVNKKQNERYQQTEDNVKASGKSILREVFGDNEQDVGSLIDEGVSSVFSSFKQPEDNEKVKKQIDKNKRSQQISTIVLGLLSGFSARKLYKGHQTKKRLVSHLTRASSKGRRSRHSSKKTSKSK